MPGEKKKDKKGKEDEVPAVLTGVYMFPNSDKYDGEYIRLEDGSIERQGSGSYYSHDGQVYHGQWDKDLMNGQGRMDMVDGAVYEGQFVNNQFHGSGRYTWPNGSFYDGLWEQNKMEGEGEFTDVHGQVWTGMFRYKAAVGLRFKLIPPKPPTPAPPRTPTPQPPGETPVSS